MHPLSELFLVFEDKDFAGRFKGFLDRFGRMSFFELERLVCLVDASHEVTEPEGLVLGTVFILSGEDGGTGAPRPIRDDPILVIDAVRKDGFDVLFG